MEEHIHCGERGRWRPVVLAAALAGVALWGSVEAEPFAKVVDPPPKDSEFYGVWQMNLGGVTVPERDAVPLPPCPGARITSFLRVGDPDASGPRKTPKIVMLTPAPRPEVAAFYRQALQGWKQGGDQGRDYFWQGEGAFRPGPIAYQNTPSVIVDDLGPMDFMDRSLMPEARTRVTIVYVPRK